MVSSRFLQLPQEIRDEIYKHTLHHADGLLYRVNKAGVGKFYRRLRRKPCRKHLAPLQEYYLRFRSVDSEHNQLKYVCKRLFRETKWLALLCNVVFFEDSPTMSGVDQCWSLLQRCARMRAAAIRSSPSAFTSSQSNESLSAMVKHCMSHAEVLLRIHIPHWTQADPDFVVRGIAYLFQLRADAKLITRLAKTTPVTYLSNSEPDIVPGNMPVPKNVRILPWEEDVDVKMFKLMFNKRPMLTLSSTEAAIGNVKSLIESWVLNGV